MIFAEEPLQLDPVRRAIHEAYLRDEAQCIETLLPVAALPDASRHRVQTNARRLVKAVRTRNHSNRGVEAFLCEYGLTSEEGVVLMCLAEALLRIPDAETADRLIHDKLSRARWDRHLGRSPSLFVNASTWGLMLTGRIVKLDPETVRDVPSFLQRMVARTGEPVIRVALRQAMRVLSHQFVAGRTIEQALERSREPAFAAARFSYDMLGEAAVCAADAERYFQAYAGAIEAVGCESGNAGASAKAPGISIKLSALHPRFELSQRDRLLDELAPRVRELAVLAKQAGLGMTIDAEEAYRLDPTLDIFERVFRDPALRDWEGFGLAAQAFQKRALPLLEWLIALARDQRRRVPLRLVKGAYWDAEIKRAQERGLKEYPVFTRKAATDVSYLACARRILAAQDAFYAQFATHNAHTLASIVEMAGPDADYEFQRLHGMGEALYACLHEQGISEKSCRIYAPVGGHEELLPYLLRRLLENGANTSFVHRVADEDVPVETIVADPVERMRAAQPARNPRIPLPVHLFGGARQNSHGINLDDTIELAALDRAMDKAASRHWEAGSEGNGNGREVRDPADRRRVVGTVWETGAQDANCAIEAAARAAPDWDGLGGNARATILERAADALEQHRAELMALCVREGGRTLADALAEVRETVDFCRYYAQHARREFEAPVPLTGPAGERNEIALHGRGVFACISPWNFPLAIFTGQVAAALAAGNAVVAKPARQTPLIAGRAVQLLREAGVPREVLHLLPGDSAVLGEVLVHHPCIAGVAFTGSTETAALLQQRIAARSGPIIPLIAETGGLNAMIVDSSALTEQVVQDTLASAFGSAGQRCSALRVLFVQEDVAPRTFELLAGAMKEMCIGDPGQLATDAGPVIDAGARDKLHRHVEWIRREGTVLYECGLPEETREGTFFAPIAVEIPSARLLEREVFGPILHVVRYRARDLDEVIETINDSGYGLTLGIHSRIEETAQYIRSRVRVGNIYVNRSIIWSVVGVQPFGGEGLSGTGPKAGGPHYLQRFATERTFTVNTAAVGGDVGLMSLDE